jgi:hypothetical protein
VSHGFTNLIRTFAAIALLSLASILAGADSVDSICSGFSGKWKLDFSKSQIGKEKEVPSEVIAEISYAKPELKVRLSKAYKAGLNVADFRYYTDGEVSTNTAEGLRWKSIQVRGSGKDLLMEQSAKFLLFTIDVNDRWTLSPDGRQLTIDRAITSVPRNEKILYVFRRQD